MSVDAGSDEVILGAREGADELPPPLGAPSESNGAEHSAAAAMSPLGSTVGPTDKGEPPLSVQAEEAGSAESVEAALGTSEEAPLQEMPLQVVESDHEADGTVADSTVALLQVAEGTQEATL